MAKREDAAEDAPPKPSREHPFLVGCSHAQAALIKRGAKKLGMKPIPFIREAALFQARDALGLKQPEGE